MAVEGFPGFLIDFGFESGLVGLVSIVCAEGIGVAHEEIFVVVVGIHKPTRDHINAIATHFVIIGVKYVHSVCFHPNLPDYDIDVRFAKDDGEFALAGVFGSWPV